MLIRCLMLHMAVFQALLSFIPASLLGVICVYLTGLITGTEISATAISQLLCHVSHDAMTRMLSISWWTARQFTGNVVRLLSLLGGEGWLILDDVLVPKPYARLIAFCSWDFDHALRHHVFGLRLVFVVWCNGWLTLPLGFYVWQKDPTRPRRKKKRRGQRGRPCKRGRKISSHKPRARKQRALRHACKQAARQVRPRTTTGTHYHTKNELARALVWRIVRAGVRVHFLLFDNWYASRKNLRFFTHMGLAWVTRLKSNTLVFDRGQRVSVQKVASSVTKANYHYYSTLGARVRSFEVQLFGSPVKLTVVKDDTHPERDRTKYLVTSELSLTNVEHVEWYRRRWPIEVFFRDTKQLLGLGRCQARKPQAVLTHSVLVCWAYVALQLLKPLSRKPQLSVSQSKKALLPLRLLISTEGATQLVRQMAEGRFEPVEVEHFWKPVRTKVVGIELPQHLGIP
jgi:hypothetical protein